VLLAGVMGFLLHFPFSPSLAPCQGAAKMPEKEVKISPAIIILPIVVAIGFTAVVALVPETIVIAVSPTTFPTRGEKPSATPVTITIRNTSRNPIWRVEILPVPAEGVVIATIPHETTGQWDSEQTGETELVDAWSRYVTMGLRLIAKPGYAIQPSEIRDISLGVIGGEFPSDTQWTIECENTSGKRFTKSVIMATI